METCYKVFRREVIQSITLESNRFGIEPEITAKVARRGYRIYEVPISLLRPRLLGRERRSTGRTASARSGRSSNTASSTIRRTSRRRTKRCAACDSLKRYNQWIWERVQPYVGQRVLEVGAGIGNDDALPLRPRADRGDGQGDAVHRPPAQRVPPAAGHRRRAPRSRSRSMRSTSRSYRLRHGASASTSSSTPPTTRRRCAAPTSCCMPGGRIIVFVPAGKDLFGIARPRHRPSAPLRERRTGREASHARDSRSRTSSIRTAPRNWPGG